MSGIAREYAGALYSLASDEGLEFIGEIRELKKALDGNPEVLKLLSNPVIPKSERQEAAGRIFSGRIHPYLLNLIKLAVKNNRVPVIPEILTDYIALWYRYSGITVAEVETAVPLEETQKSRLHTALEKKYGGNVEMRLAVNPSLIGGVRVTVGDNLADNTVRHKIDGLDRQLKQTVI